MSRRVGLDEGERGGSELKRGNGDIERAKGAPASWFWLVSDFGSGGGTEGAFGSGGGDERRRGRAEEREEACHRARV